MFIEIKYLKRLNNKYWRKTIPIFWIEAHETRFVFPSDGTLEIYQGCRNSCYVLLHLVYATHSQVQRHCLHAFIPPYLKIYGRMNILLLKTFDKIIIFYVSKHITNLWTKELWYPFLNYWDVTHITNIRKPKITKHACKTKTIWFQKIIIHLYERNFGMH